jgi:hypothetical protein
MQMSIEKDILENLPLQSVPIWASYKTIIS